jgi:hypothetical protein
VTATEAPARAKSDLLAHFAAFIAERHPFALSRRSPKRSRRSTQYISHPDYPWHRLRKETPGGVYESYVDLVPGQWTKVRIVVAGNKARLYAALWLGEGTEAWFSKVIVKWPSSPRPDRRRLR